MASNGLAPDPTDAVGTPHITSNTTSSPVRNSSPLTIGIPAILGKSTTSGMAPEDNDRINSKAFEDYQAKQTKAAGEKGIGKDYLAPALPMGLGILGSMLGPEGAASGAGLGGILNSIIQKDAPLTPSETAETAIPSALMGYFGGKLPGGAVTGPLMNTIIGSGARGIMNPEAGPQSPGDFGTDFLKNLALHNSISGILHLTGNTTPSDSGTPMETGVNRLREQVVRGGPPQEQGIPPKPTTELGTQAMTSIRSKMAQAKGVEKQAWNTFRKQYLDPNTEHLQKLLGYEESKIIDPATGKPTLVPKLEDIEVKGPIYTANTQAAAAEALPKIQKFMGKDSFGTLPDWAQKKYQNIYDTIKDLSTPTQVYHNGQETPVLLKEYEAVKDLSTQIRKKFGETKETDFPTAQLMKVADTLEQDIKLSMDNFWKGGPNATQALGIARKSTEYQKSVYGREIQNKLQGSYETGAKNKFVPGDPSKVFKDAFKGGPEETTRLINALGPENSDLVRQEYFDNHLMPKVFGNNYEKFDSKAGISELENPNSPIRSIYNADERGNMLQFLRAAEKSSEDSAMQVAGKYLRVRAGIGTAKWLTGMHGNPLTMMIPMDKVMNWALENKNSGNIASRLVKIGSETTEANATTQLMLKSMKGLPVLVRLPGEDKDRKATITEGGKLKYSDN